MLEPYVRPTFHQYIVEPLLNIRVLRRYLSPNGCTFAAAITGGSVALALFYQQIIIAISLLLFSGLLDIIDGALARQQNKTTALGTIFDIMSDRFVECSVILGLLLQAPQERGLACCVMMGSILLCVSSFLVVGIFSENQTKKSFYYSPGLIERFEAFLFFIAMMLNPAFFQPIACLFSVLVLYTTVTRINEFAKQIKNDE